MLWLLGSAFFLWLAFREFYHRVVPPKGYDSPDSTPISVPYVVTTLTLAVALAYTPVRTWQFERFLTARARILAESPKAFVHCNTLVDTFLDQNVFAAGHASPETGRIVFQHGWCGHLMDHLRHPERADLQGIISLHVFVHETMHVRGEMNEAKTECQAIQRHYRAARLLGVPDQLARASGLAYYNGPYQERGAIGGAWGYYYSSECAPGKSMDEGLTDSTWDQAPG